MRERIGWDQQTEWLKAGLAGNGVFLNARTPTGKVNPMTISKAYSFLEVEGLLERRRGVGLFVTELPGDQHKQIKLEILKTAIEKADTDIHKKRAQYFYETFKPMKEEVLSKIEFDELNSKDKIFCRTTQTRWQVLVRTHAGVIDPSSASGLVSSA